jgi:hypothetical protein
MVYTPVIGFHGCLKLAHFVEVVGTEELFAGEL